MAETTVDQMSCPAQNDVDPGTTVFCGKSRWHEGPHVAADGDRTVEWWFIGDEVREVEHDNA